MNEPMNALRFASTAAVWASFSVVMGCSGSSSAPSDEGEHSGTDDAGSTADAGLRTQCPVAANFPSGLPECVQANDCQSDRLPSSNCEYCQPFNPAICDLGRCTTPPLLQGSEGIVLRFRVSGSILTDVQRFAGFAVAAETTGGATISCSDVYGSNWDLAEPCYNWIDSRSTEATGDGDTFPIRFGRFPGGRRVLLIVYGFDNDRARGTPLGVSCTEVDVDPAGTNTQDQEVDGDMMRRIQ